MKQQVTGRLWRVLAVLTQPVRRRWRRRQAVSARKLWSAQEPALRSQFLGLAQRLGKPRGLTWVCIEWTGPVLFAWDTQSGLLTAFAGVVIQFEPIPGGDMEDVPAATLPRTAAALFHYQRGGWGTGGRAVFNLTPSAALARLADQFQPVESDEKR